MAATANPRVVHIVQTLVGGGAERAVRLLCAGLPAAGIEAGVVSVYPSGLDDGVPLGPGVALVDLARDGRRDLRFFPRLVAALRELRPDVVHAHLHTGQYAGRIAALISGVPKIVFTVHGREPGGPVRWMLDRVLHARTSRFVVFTHTQRLRYAREAAVPLERIAVIPNGAMPPAAWLARSEARRCLGLPSDAFVVYAVGRQSAEKNHLALLEGVARARAAGASAMHLVMAGTGPLAAELRERAAALGIWESVRFLGFRDDATSLFAAMDLFALPSFREGMPLALGEAMLAGLPPLTTPWRDHADFVEDGATGFVAGGFDGEALGATLLRAYRDELGRARIALAARRAAQRAFDPEAMVRAHADLYREVAAAR